MYQTTHMQVPFVTLRGQEVTVDAGLVKLLEDLRFLGVETQFSCQGDEFAPYICADGRSFSRLIRKIWWMYLRKTLSPQARGLVKLFMTHKQEIEIALYRDEGTRQVFVWKLLTSSEGLPYSRQEFSLERTWSNQHGFRVTVRWPEEFTANVQQLVEEVSRLKHGLK